MQNSDRNTDQPDVIDSAQFLSLDLKQAIAAVQRNKNWISLIVLACLALGLLVTLLMVPRYVASAQVLVEQNADTIIEGSELQDTTNQQWDAQRFLETQVDIMRSRTLAERVARSAALINDAAFYDAMGESIPTQNDLELDTPSNDDLRHLRLDTVVELLQEHLRIILPGDSRVIKIEFESTDPEFAAKIANVYAENYIETNLKRKFESSAYARKFISSQLSDARAKVEASERELNQYSRAAGLIRVSGQGQNADKETTLSITNNSLIQVNAAAATATAERLAAEDRWKTISNEPVLAIPQVIENAAIQEILQQKAALEAQLADEKSRHLASYPSVKVLSAQIDELNQRIEKIGASIKRSLYLEYQSALERQNSLTQQVQKLREEAMGEQERGVGYAVLKRVAETDRALYDTLLERYNQLSASAGSTSNNVTLVDRAEVPREPSSPNIVTNLILSFIIGLFFAGAFVFVREYFDDVIRAPEDVERKLSATLLGLVPFSAGGHVHENLKDSKSTIAEAYHSLVANLRFTTPSGFPHTMVVTSTHESEGKTTTAQTVAQDIARLGKRVLLIDGDLRRPTLHRQIASPNTLGLTELLVGNANLDELVVSSEFEGLTYLTALPIPPEPSILLGSERLREVIAEAKSKFDVVIFDSAPMLGLSDTASIASLTNGVLFVIDASKFHRGAVKSALRRLAIVNANVLGVVLTKFDVSTAGSEYSYYGYNYYSYGSKSDGADE